MVGRVRRAHGIRGELVIEALTSAPDAVYAAGRRVFAGTTNGKLSPGTHEMRITAATPFKGGWIVSFDGIDSRSVAETWRNRYVLLPEDELEPPAEGEVFVHDLIGMRVVHVNGEEVGSVAQVLEMPQGLVIEIARERKKSVLIQFDDRNVTEVDSTERVIRVDPMAGLLD